MENELKHELTEDIQHDLASMLYHANTYHTDFYNDTIDDFIKELNKRGASLPKNVSMQYSRYSANRRKLTYEL